MRFGNKKIAVYFAANVERANEIKGDLPSVAINQYNHYILKARTLLEKCGIKVAQLRFCGQDGNGGRRRG
jgi:hypothetical protein